MMEMLELTERAGLDMSAVLSSLHSLADNYFPLVTVLRGSKVES